MFTFFTKIGSNFKAILLTAPNFLQFLYICKILWWGIGGILGVRFIINELNYLVIPPNCFFLTVIGIIGLFGVIFNEYILNTIFAFSMLFVSTCIGITFLGHRLESISAGTYFLDIFGVIWLALRLQQDRLKQKRFSKFSEGDQ